MISGAQFGRESCVHLARISTMDHSNKFYRGTGVGIIDKIVSVEKLIKSIQHETKLAVARVMEMI